MKDKEVSLGASHEKGESYYVPGTGEKLVRLRTIASPVPGTFTPKLERTHRSAFACVSSASFV